ncbi:MAG: efflux RND transporter periplasmic adaptor subunit [Anaerolineae bacterium]|nr:efflux RND transporter periplasmic adaptor subunit [Anaerolineae bacterium]
MNRSWRVIAVPLVLAAVLLVSGCLGAGASNSSEVVDTATVRRDMLLVTIDGAGSVVPGSEISLAFSSGGRVAEVLVEEGQSVEEGQPLIRLETDDLELQVAQSRATLASAEAQLAQLLVAPRVEQVAVQEANVAAAQAQLNAAAANREQVLAGADDGQIASAEANLASAVAQQKSAFDMHERTMECFIFEWPRSSGTERTICPALGVPEEQARYSLESADAALAAAQAQLDELSKGPDTYQLASAQSSVSSAVAHRDMNQAQRDLLLAGGDEHDIEIAQASVDDARAALEQAELAIENATLTAPRAGTVTFRDARLGEIVSAGQTAVVISDLASLEVEINLDETDIATVSAGQEARVTIGAFPGIELVGTVKSIASVAESQSGIVLFPVTIEVTVSDLVVRAGMTADVAIVAASQPDALIVPLRTVHVDGVRTYVERIRDGESEDVDVELGLITDTVIEIVHGLNEGDVIAVVPVSTSSDSGMPGPMGMGVH